MSFDDLWAVGRRQVAPRLGLAGLPLAWFVALAHIASAVRSAAGGVILMPPPLYISLLILHTT